MGKLALVALLLGLLGLISVFLGFMTGLIALIIFGVIAMPVSLLLAFSSLVFYIVHILLTPTRPRTDYIR